MKICFIIPWISKSRGGTENVGQTMANAMAARGHDVHIVTFDDECAPSRWPLTEDIVLHYASEGSGPEHDSQLLFQVAMIDPDLIVGLHMNRTFLRYLKLGGKLGVPVVMSEHIDPRFPVRIGSFTREERQVAFQGAARVHLLVDAFRASLPEHMQDRIEVIPNTVPPARTLADPQSAPKKPKTLVTVARLVARKNLQHLISEFALISWRFADWKLKIIGDGNMRSRLEKQAREAGVYEKIEFVGEVEDVYPHLASAHCFVLPSLFEGFPMSTLEAMAHGLPIVGQAVCNGVNVQVEDGVNGFLVAKSSQQGGLANALNAIMGDDDLRGRMGAASLERYQTLFSNDLIYDKWENLFEKARTVSPPEPIALQQRLDLEIDQLLRGVGSYVSI